MDPSALLRTWLHAHEEDSGDDMVFRSESHKFPPSRGRYGFALKPEGLMTGMGPSARDVPESHEGGRWTLDERGTLLLEEPGGVRRRFQVVELGADRLVLREMKTV
ncbi:hypothetical protein [uncultured Paludibaculum sp.]|uniref:hypothetical protein n=1 Tax=uncultured Paludibaculum sp. TaxID=1765020 RepID=UPI002AAAA12A|nr:hypothetical protein [uncultured Paludibaculum sp.]